jgi:hypothetical protein
MLYSPFCSEIYAVAASMWFQACGGKVFDVLVLPVFRPACEKPVTLEWKLSPGHKLKTQYSKLDAAARSAHDQLSRQANLARPLLGLLDLLDQQLDGFCP